MAETLESAGKRRSVLVERLGDVAETSGSEKPPPQLLEAIGNLAEFHREHEKFYSQAPLQQAVEVQAASRVFKALADRWSAVDPAEHRLASPFAGAEDLNAPGLVAESGVLFMEGEGEPLEIKRLRRGLETLAGDVEQTGEWLAGAMEQAWQVAGALAAYPVLADLLGERHRIIANDWQSASQQALVGRLLRRALDLVAKIDFLPKALRADMAGERRNAAYLYSASELIDRAADLLAESATLVHENERRWRVFGRRVNELIAAANNSG
jgi:hypothetical protein